VSRVWPLAQLAQLYVGPSGGGFVLHFHGGIKEAAFMPLRNDAAACAQLLASAVRAALAAGAILPADTQASLARATAHAAPPPAAPSVRLPPNVRLPDQAALERELGGQLSPGVLEEHVAAELQLRALRERQPPSQPGPLRPTWSPPAPAPAQMPTLYRPVDFGAVSQPASPGPSYHPPPQPSPPLAAPQSPRPSAADAEAAVDALVEGIVADASSLRATLDAGGAAGPAAEAVATRLVPLCALVAGHLGVAHWAPLQVSDPAASVHAVPRQGRAALWAALAADAASLLARAGRPLEGTTAAGTTDTPLLDLSDDEPQAPPPSPPVIDLPPLISWDDAVPVAPPATLPPLPPLEPPAPVLQSGRARSSVNNCCVCLERPPDTVLLECGHAGLCEICAGDLLRRRQPCPVCRATIARVARIYK